MGASFVSQTTSFDAQETSSTILSLPTDILILILKKFGLSELCAVSRTCKLLHTLVCECGWTSYLRANVRPSHSLSCARVLWSPLAQARYNTLTDDAWAKSEFVARPLSRPWAGKLQPLLAANASRLVVAAGSNLDFYRFTNSDCDQDAPGVHFEGSCTLNQRPEIRQDITGITFIPDGGLDRTLYVGYEDGTIERVFITPKRSVEGTMLEHSSKCLRPFHNNGDLIESLSSASNFLLSLSANGTASLMNIDSMTTPPHRIELNNRSWVAHLALQSSTPYAVLGTSSTTPLAVHSIMEAEFSTTPSVILSTGKSSRGYRPSAVYGISGAPSSSPWGASDQIVVSGWYDGVVRVHDLRSPVRDPTTNLSETTAHRAPVLSLYDPWSYEPIYAVDCGGGSSSHIAAGSARHSVVAFWDVRFCSRGWSVHAPGNDSSPVYSLILESSRLFGANQSRPFVCDFGPGVTQNTYPRLPTHPRDGLQIEGIGYFTTKYQHSQILGLDTLNNQV